MVVHKGVEIPPHCFEAADIVCQFEIIVVVVRGIDTFVHLVVGDGMKHLRIDPAGVFAVDDFAHQPEFRLDFICQPA